MDHMKKFDELMRILDTRKFPIDGMRDLILQKALAADANESNPLRFRSPSVGHRRRRSEG